MRDHFNYTYYIDNILKYIKLIMKCNLNEISANKILHHSRLWDECSPIYSIYTQSITGNFFILLTSS